jgi:hypothetical protein
VLQDQSAKKEIKTIQSNGKDIKIGGYYSETAMNFRIVAENNQKTSFMRKNSK